MTKLERRELEIETDAIEEAKRRVKRSAARGPMRLLQAAFEPLAKAIREQQDAVSEGARWPYGVALIAIDAEKLALITLGVILKSLGDPEMTEEGPPAINVMREIAQSSWIENQRDKLRGRERDLADLLLKRNRNPWHARRNAAEKIEAFRKKSWAHDDMGLQLGGALVDLAVEKTGLVYKLNRPKAQATIQLTDKGKQQVKELQQVAECLLVPVYRPMIIPPRRWKDGKGGGYLVVSPGLVKRQDGVAEPLPHGDDRIACEVLNAIQETPWRINRRLLKVMAEAYQSGEPREVLPPPLPDVDQAKDLTARWYRETLSAHDAMNRRLMLANAFAREKAIYFPCNLDWRGRLYSIPQTVNPQTDDAGRALLEFGRGKPLGERGAFWLAVHLANLYGHRVDKLSFDARVAWVKNCEEVILDSAKRPLNGRMSWVKAEKPWRFLAACMEWAGYFAEGPGLVSRQPVAMDGTCNGLQHFSALGRDPEGARWTNVVPSPAPQDIYQEVAHRLIKRVEPYEALGDPDILAWRGIIDRALVKKPTMTTPYGVTPEGIFGQIREAVRQDFPDRFVRHGHTSKFLAERLVEAIGEVVVHAVKITVWLRTLATILGEKGKPIPWTLPTGFQVTNDYREFEEHRVDTALITLQTLRHKEGAGIDLKEQENGITANLVQSLDAAHLMFTVQELYRRGLRDFAMVHDSYAVHACDVDLMNEVLREQFVRLHNTEFTLPGFFEQVKASAPGIELPPPPPLGALDLAEVLKSEYLFS